jgi:CBS domain-containing protein
MSVRVSQLMTREIVTCRPGDDLCHVGRMMYDRDIGCIPVVDNDNRLLGMLTDRDICVAACTQRKAPQDISAESVMARQVFTCSPEDTLVEAEEVMRSHQIRRVPIVDDDNRVVGILALNDLALEAEREQGLRPRQLTTHEVAATLAAICQHRREPAAAARTAAA